MNNVVISGSLVCGPPAASDSAFPAGVANIVFATSPAQKPAPVQSSNVRNVNSAAAFVPLDGLGAGETLTEGNTLYMRSLSPMQIRMTFKETPSNVVSVVYLQGLLILEISAANPLILLEVMGVGTLEYFVSGNI